MAHQFSFLSSMEFERAIFRVYERCLDGMRDESDDNVHRSKGCRFMFVLAASVGTFFLCSLILLHSHFVGQHGCLPFILADAQNITLGPKINGSLLLRYDQILNINIDPEFMPKNLRAPNNRRLTNNVERILRNERFSILNTTINATETETSSSQVFIPDFDYQFSYNLGVLFLPENMRVAHGFETINVTMKASDCFGGRTTQYLLSTYGIDTLVINSLMYTFRKPGYMVTSIGEYFKWTSTDITPYTHIGQWFNWKVNVFLLSLLAFFFLTSVTALLVRVLISSGVVLLFPVFYIVQLLGFPAINLRIISLSYPWIGVPLEMIRARNQSFIPFIIAHITRCGVYYILYQAAQLSFGMWFYRPNGSPGQPEIWLFAVVMIVEYFAMIYVRAKRSIQIFPRAFFLFFLLFHFYYYSFPGGFHILALFTLLMYSCALMALCVGEFEIQAYYTGVVNIDSPRMQYNSLPWSSIRSDLAHDFTLFMPLTDTSVALYDINVPALGAPGPLSPPNNNQPIAGPHQSPPTPGTTTSPGGTRRPGPGDYNDLESGRGYANGGIGSEVELTRMSHGQSSNSGNSISGVSGRAGRGRNEYSRLVDSSNHNEDSEDA